MNIAEPNYAAEMRLPTGKTCADCVHGPRCDALFGAIRRAFTSCDFWPSKFTPAEPSSVLFAEELETARNHQTEGAQ